MRNGVARARIVRETPPRAMAHENAVLRHSLERASVSERPVSMDAQKPLSIAELREIGLFGALGDEVLARLASTLTVITPGAGDVLFREGEEANAMYLVISGELEVRKRSRSGIDTRVAVLGPSGWFGAMSIGAIHPR